MKLTLRRLLTIKYPDHYKKDIAKMLMYTDVHLSRILNGKADIKHHVYVRILRLLDIEAEELSQCIDVDKSTLLLALKELNMEEEYQNLKKGGE